jgi:hypothetical protein
LRFSQVQQTAEFAQISGVAAVAQSVEQRIRNAKVTSSIPVSGTKNQRLITLLGYKPFFFSGVN